MGSGSEVLLPHGIVERHLRPFLPGLDEGSQVDCGSLPALDSWPGPNSDSSDEYKQTPGTIQLARFLFGWEVFSSGALRRAGMQ